LGKEITVVTHVTADATVERVGVSRSARSADTPSGSSATSP
jgi:hypothetical protein